VAYIFWCEYNAKLVLRNSTGQQNEIVVPKHDSKGKLTCGLQLRSDVALQGYLDRLQAADFGSNKSDIIRRSLTLYYFLWQRRGNGWDCVYVDERGQSTLIPILSLLTSRRDSRDQPDERPKPKLLPSPFGANENN
jgi:hypothetical protein